MLKKRVSLHKYERGVDTIPIGKKHTTYTTNWSGRLWIPIYHLSDSLEESESWRVLVVVSPAWISFYVPRLKKRISQARVESTNFSANQVWSRNVTSYLQSLSSQRFRATSLLKWISSLPLKVSPLGHRQLLGYVIMDSTISWQDTPCATFKC